MSELKNTRPEIEDVIGDVFNGNVLKNASGFIAYLRENKINPQWSATNVWKISYKTYSVCFIRLYGAADYHNLKESSWHIIPFIGEYEGFTLSDEFKEIVWSNKRTCQSCGKCTLEINKIFEKSMSTLVRNRLFLPTPTLRALNVLKN